MLENFARILNTSVEGTRRLSGGDISEVYWVKTGWEESVIKVNRDLKRPDLLQKEKAGLAALSATRTVRIPAIQQYVRDENVEYLVMEYIPTGQPKPGSLQQLATDLAQLHQQSGPFFGGHEDNYIGQLCQRNTPTADWADFYGQQRLLPQLQLAYDHDLLSAVPAESLLEQRCNELLGNPAPCPLHGDLWGGNYLVASNGQPYLIDPSFYYGHHEVDLAMSQLFGGFGAAFYQHYYEILPPQAGVEERKDLYQLYYLLVHLNMFGTSYRGSVLKIIKKYF